MAWYDACLQRFYLYWVSEKNWDVLKSIAITLILDYGNENVLALVLKISNVPRFAIFIHIFVIHLKSLRNLFF